MTGFSSSVHLYLITVHVEKMRFVCCSSLMLVITVGYRLQKLISNRQQDKQNLAILDRRVQEERKQKMTLEQQLVAEKRRKTDDASRKADEPSRAAVAVASSSRSVHTSACCCHICEYFLVCVVL